jgi:DNA-binding LytR/AlgR family response regulator
MVDLLRKPHPFIFNKASVLVPGVISVFIMIVIAPFDFQEMSMEMRIPVALLFGLIASLSVILVVWGLRNLFPAYMDPDQWTVGKEIALFVAVVLAISAFIVLAFTILGLSDNSLPSLLYGIVLKTIGIAILPIIILVLFEQLSYHRLQLVKARELNKSVSESHGKRGIFPGSVQGDPPEKVLFEGENEKPVAFLDADKIAYLKAEGNYVEIYHQEGSPRMQRVLVRNRLKNCLQKLPESQFFHCHKSFVVNTHWITEIRGNARNLELVLKNSDIPIPVSRSRVGELEGLLAQPASGG